ncbi:hypothetical protein E2562_018531 [Oryza meyeriana var. granulata]|uniref:3-beta hydroxysteroid dehydrogenase/isomerase domain-containing protein n=1 Tax=Oryza meyeriana var. granulata TaxID=110450 RepID=A0A6G1F920_9ORYZ|nr:hypothetical protein E2562_018531 [Oryza meyeriana var. granulata]
MAARSSSDSAAPSIRLPPLQFGLRPSDSATIAASLLLHELCRRSTAATTARDVPRSSAREAREASVELWGRRQRWRKGRGSPVPLELLPLATGLRRAGGMRAGLAKFASARDPRKNAMAFAGCHGVFHVASPVSVAYFVDMGVRRGVHMYCYAKMMAEDITATEEASKVAAIAAAGGGAALHDGGADH